MKIKIAFMLINMNIGGTEKALLNMISEMPKEQYEITVILLEQKGPLLSILPSHVRIEHVEGFERVKPLLNNPLHDEAIKRWKQGLWLEAITSVYLYILRKVIRNNHAFFHVLSRDLHLSLKEFDIAVAYAGPMDFISYFVVNHLKAKRKIQWIHFDIRKVGYHKKFVAKLYEKFDNIFVVSEEGKSEFSKVFPRLRGKVETFTNYISPNTVIQMAEEGPGFSRIDSFQGIRIVTVGRLSKEKGQDMAIQVLSKLKKEGYSVRWYCVGEGPAREEYETLIRSLGLEEDFILLGAYLNPYPFMQQCDIYVQPSRHEGYCITLAEAKCFNVPIITTNFVGAFEQMLNVDAGYIVDVNEDALYNALRQILDDEVLRTRLRRVSRRQENDSKEWLQKLY